MSEIITHNGLPVVVTTHAAERYLTRVEGRPNGCTYRARKVLLKAFTDARQVQPSALAQVQRAIRHDRPGLYFYDQSRGVLLVCAVDPNRDGEPRLKVLTCYPHSRKSLRPAAASPREYRGNTSRRHRRRSATQLATGMPPHKVAAAEKWRRKKRRC